MEQEGEITVVNGYRGPKLITGSIISKDQETLMTAADYIQAE